MQSQSINAPPNRQVNTQEPSNQELILFYSKDCDHSKNLFNLIRTVPQLANALKPMDVDEYSNLPIKSTPAIKVGNNIFEGNDAFGWVQMQIQGMGQQGQQQQRQGQGQHQQGQGQHQQGRMQGQGQHQQGQRGQQGNGQTI